MATARSAQPICGRCGETAGAGELVTLAVRGELVAVCSRCFLLEEVGSLTSSLPAGDSTRSLVEEGLRALYEVVLARAREEAARQFQDAAESGR